MGDARLSKRLVNVARAAAKGYYRLIDMIPRQSARPKKSKQQARPKRPARAADLAVRFMIQPGRHQAGKDSIDIWLIHAREENPLPNTEAVSGSC